MYAYSPVPYMDDWDANLTFVMDVRDGAAHAWWQQHNEHRIVLTRLLLYPTMTVLGGHQWLLSLVSMASVATGGWLFAAIARQGRGTRPLPQAWRPWIAVLTGVLWLWSQHETLEWGLNVAFVLAVLAPTAALWVQGRGAAGQRATTRGEHAVAAGLGLTAALTVAGGLLALPVLALRAWLVRASWRVVGAYALLGMLGAAVYLTDYVTPPSSGSPVVTMLTSPLKVGAFVASSSAAPSGG